MTKLNRRQFIGAAAAAGAGATAAALPTFAQSASAASSKAATIIKNARVFVGDDANTMADAVAIGADGRILAVGGNRSVMSYLGYSTEVLDASGGTVMAGIHDGHVHPMYAGINSLSPTLEDAEMSAADLQAALTAFLADPTYGTEPDAWLNVGGWNPVGCSQRRPAAQRPPGRAGDRAPDRTQRAPTATTRGSTARRCRSQGSTRTPPTRPEVRSSATATATRPAS